MSNNENTIEEINLQNLIFYFKEELLDIKNGKKLENSMSLRTRKKFVENGILRRFGSLYELTDMGLALLSSKSME